MGKRLTKMQILRLRQISDYRGSTEYPNAPFWKDSATDKSLIKRGLVERADIQRTLGGGGTVGGFSVTWHACRLTDAGRAALSRATPTPGGQDGR